MVRVQPGELRSTCKASETTRGPVEAPSFRTEPRTASVVGECVNRLASAWLAAGDRGDVDEFDQYLHSEVVVHAPLGLSTTGVEAEKDVWADAKRARCLTFEVRKRWARGHEQWLESSSRALSAEGSRGSRPRGGSSISIRSSRSLPRRVDRRGVGARRHRSMLRRLSARPVVAWRSGDRARVAGARGACVGRRAFGRYPERAHVCCRRRSRHGGRPAGWLRWRGDGLRPHLQPTRRISYLLSRRCSGVVRPRCAPRDHARRYPGIALAAQSRAKDTALRANHRLHVETRTWRRALRLRREDQERGIGVGGGIPWPRRTPANDLCARRRV